MSVLRCTCKVFVHKCCKGLDLSGVGGDDAVGAYLACMVHVTSRTLRRACRTRVLLLVQSADTAYLAKPRDPCMRCGVFAVLFASCVAHWSLSNQAPVDWFSRKRTAYELYQS